MIDACANQHTTGAAFGRLQSGGLIVLAAVSATATSVVLEPSARSYPGIAALEVLVIVGFATAGYLLSQDPTQRSNGRLLIASALLQVLTHLHLVGDSPLPMIAWFCGPLSAMPAAVVLLRFPGRRLDQLARRWATFNLVWLVGSRLLFVVPPADRRLGWWPALPLSKHASAVGSTVGNAVLSASTLFFAFLLVRRLRRSHGVARHEIAPVLVASISASLTVVLHLMSVANSQHGVRPVVLGLEQCGLIAVPAAFIFSAIVMRIARAAVGDLLLKVNHSTTMYALQQALAETFSDPDLRLLCWRQGEAQWFDVHGNAIDPATTAGKLRVPVEGSDGPLALIVTDDAISRQKHLVASTVAATRLTLLNVAALAEVQESRNRIVQAGLSERRRLERDLHDGVQQRLLAIKMQLERVRTAAGDLDRTRDLAEDAITDISETMSALRDLARGVHPAVLTQSGLLAAVESAADRLPLSVLVNIPDRRWEQSVEGTAYFFISEGLNNVVKHADCDRAEVVVSDDGHNLNIEVSDDGVGGADANLGTGLIGLADRIAAVGGAIDLISEKEDGTCLRAFIPYVSR